MTSYCGENIKIEIFGESHGEEIGVVIKGLPAGKAIDVAKLGEFLARRAP
ncbi:MAG: chorismate synthase, partial [Oscillospiraceae bacterium]|nr:chorismate synthase [Oscillospiraceae bacterium]